MARAERVVAKPPKASLLDRFLILKKHATGPGAFLYASMMISNALGYLFFVILARIVTVEEYGEIVTLTASVYVLAVIVRSIQSQAAHTISQSEHSDRSDALGFAVLRQSLSWTIFGAALVFALFWLASPLIAEYLNLSSPTLVIVLGAYLASYLFLPVPRGLLLGAGRLRYAGWGYLVEPIARLGVALALVFSPLRTVGVLLGYFAGKMAAYLFAVWPFFRLRHKAAISPPLSSRLWSLDKPFLLAIIVNTSLMALGSIDPFVIKHFFSPTLAGRFSVAFLLGRVILLSTMSASWVTFSTTVRHKIHDPEVRKPLLRGLLLGGGIAGLVTLIYWIAPGVAVTALGGEAYQAASGFVGLVGLEMMLFTLISIQAYYHIAVRNTKMLLPFSLALIMEVTLLSMFHDTPNQIIYDTIGTLGVLLLWVSILTVRALSPREERMRVPRVCVVIRSDYRSDPRPRREAEALMDDGWQVDVICDAADMKPRVQEFKGARIFRMPRVQQTERTSVVISLLNYTSFFLAAAVQLSWLHLRRPYHLVHVHNMPDFLVFITLIPRLMGAKVVLDIHDLMPEVASLRFGVGLNHPVVRVLRWIERLSASFAFHIVTAGEPFKRRLAQNGIREQKITSIMNSPDPRIFSPRSASSRHRPDNGRFVLSYHGSLLEYNDLEVVLKAMALSQDKMPDLEFRIYGEGRTESRLRSLSKALSLNEQVRFYGRVPLDSIPSLIEDADLGVAPQRKSSFTSLNYPTKAFEYIALGIPVVMAWSPALDEVFGDMPGIYFEPEDSVELSDRIWKFYSDRAKGPAIASLQQAACRLIDWQQERHRFADLIDSIAGPLEIEVEAAAARAGELRTIK